MEVFNETPYQVGHTVAMYTPGQPFMSVVVKGKFRLVDGGPCTPLPNAQEPWIVRPANFLDAHGNSFKLPADNVPFKMQGECLFIGSAHAPGGKPVGALEVGLSVGPVSKRLNIFGARKWVREADGSVRLTEPEPFTEMPMRAEYAHGGPGSKYNEHGIGYEPLGPNMGDSVPAANIMHPDQVGVSWERDVPWAGLSMLAPNMLPRREMLGTFDDKWRLRRLPLPPEDFDPRFFASAPEDQRIEGYFKGDEAIRLSNLHPDNPDFQSAFPGTAVRGFVHHRPDPKHPDELEFAEVVTVLDTCIVDVPDETLTLVWRGTLEIANRFHGHIDHLLVVEEPVGQHASPEVYANILKEKLVDPSIEETKKAEEERQKQIAEINKEGLAAIVDTLRKGGGSPELIARIEQAKSIDEAQQLIAEEVEKFNAILSQGSGVP